MRALLVVLTVLAVGLAGCLGAAGPAGTSSGGDLPTADDGDATTTYELPETLGGYEQAAVFDTDAGGNGVWIDEDRSLLLTSTGGGGLYILDISDPANISQVARVEDNYARDVDLLTLQDEDNHTRYIAALAGGGDGLHLVDITDPANPVHLSTTELPAGTHNLAVVPGTPYVYNSGGGGAIYGIDATDPTDPEVFEFAIPMVMGVQPIQSDGCHDIVVRVDLDLAFCAGGGTYYGMGGGETFIWDISEDPTDPEWIGVIDNPFIMYHHQAFANEAGDILLINDEWIAPNCAQLPGRAQGTPTAAAWIYDISDPTSPTLLSWVQAPMPEETPPPINCGSHFGDLIDGHEAASWGWYGGGTLLIDFEDPMNPQILDIAPAVGSTWDARYFNGHVYTGSGDVQVLKVV